VPEVTLKSFAKALQRKRIEPVGRGSDMIIFIELRRFQHGRDEKAFRNKAKGILRAQIKRRNLDYCELAEKLAKHGIQENARNLSNKIARRGFTAEFFVSCLIAIGCHTARLHEAD